MIRRRIQETKNYEYVSHFVGLCLMCSISLRILMDRQLKMETIIANIELDSNLDKESKKQQVIYASVCDITINNLLRKIVLYYHYF